MSAETPDIQNQKKPVKLAIVSLSTFGYFERMAERAKAMGIETEFFDERPSSDIGAKLFYRLAPRSITRYFSDQHIYALCDKLIEANFTHVLIVFAELLEPKHVLKLKAHGLKICRYTWDSLGNRSSVTQLDPLMSAIGSFDPVDCQTHGYQYIPLYSEYVPQNTKPASERAIDFYFCGTMHSNRPGFIRKMAKVAQRQNWTICLKLFYHSRWIYIIRNIMSWEALSIFKTISSTGFSHKETLDDCARSRVVIDIQHPKQSGLTMRTFETLAQGSVVLTTNKLALSYLDPAFHNRVVILHESAIEKSMASALTAEPGKISADQRHALSIERFLEQIFNLLGIVKKS